MQFTIVISIISVTIFLIFIDKSKFIKFLPTCYFAGLLDLYTDLITAHYPFWHYKSTKEIYQILIHPMNTFGIYFVITYLFLQTLPKKQNIVSISLHIFYWLIPSLAIELLATNLGVLIYGHGWNTYYSFLADICIYLILYFHFKLTEKLRLKNAKHI